MTRVDFYVLSDSRPRARELTACRLAEKAWQAGHRVFIHTASRTAAAHINDLLWTFRDRSFVPHALDESEDTQAIPVLIGTGDKPPSDCELLINLTDGVPGFFSGFGRVLELVGSGEADRNAGRQRFRFYQERGYPLQTHKL